MSVSRKQIKSERRRQRELLERSRVVEQRVSRRRRYGLMGLSALLLVLLVGGIAYAMFRTTDASTVAENADTGRKAPDQHSVGYPDQGNLHIQSVDQPHTPYNTDPPTSGPHLGQLAPAGFHDQPIPKELVVHNLEDGYVAIWYRPDLPEDQKNQLRALVESYTAHVIAVPYDTLDVPIALTAWTRLDRLDGYDEQRIRNFIEAYAGIDHHKR